MKNNVDFTKTDISWIGSIPSTWELKKIKYIFWERKEINNPLRSDNLISLTMDRGVIPHSEKTGGGNKPKEDLTKYKMVYPGDIVVNSMNVISGSVGISDYFGIVSPVYYMLIPKGQSSPRYFHHLFRTESFQKSLYGLGNGILIKENEETGKLNTIRMRIPMDKLGNQFIPLPPVREQELITEFLDKKTDQIDFLIEKIQKKIELLKEQRTSLINQYVTKGLDPNVEMKDSGVEWIGEIPNHYTLQKIKYLFKEKKSKSNPDLNSGSISFGQVVYKDDESILESTKESYQEVLEGEFLINPLNLNYDLKSLRIGRSKINVVVSQGYIVLQILEGQYPDYFEYLLRKFDVVHMKSLGQGVRQTISFNNLKNEELVIPPIEEQKRIVCELNLKTNQIDRLCSVEEQRISLLQEYRQSLISSVVTGKVKVTEDMI